MKRRPPLRWILLFFATALIAWAVFAGLALKGAADHAQAGMDLLTGVEGFNADTTGELLDAATSDEVLGDDASEVLRSAATEFEQANTQVDSAAIAPLRFLPVVGTQVNSVDQLSSSAATVSESAAEAFDGLSEVLDSEAATPEGRAQAVADVGTTLLQFQGEVSNLGLGPIAGLLPPLARARDDFSERLGRIQQRLDEAVPAALGTAEFLQGPSRYLLFAANNAEMRSGSGMFLQAAPLEVADGEFHFGEFEPTGDLLAEPGTELDPEIEQLWGSLEPDREFRNVNLTPRFDESARMASDMWESSGRGSTDGVMAVDVVALEQLLELVGPVEVPGVVGEAPTVVTAETVAQDILLEQYRAYEDDRNERRDRLGRVATSVLEALNNTDVSASELLDVLVAVATGRHLLAWSSIPEQNAAWKAIGANGETVDNQLGVLLDNRGGDKLDPFLDVSVTLTKSESSGGSESTRLRMEIELTNNTPHGLPPYVAGPAVGSTYPEGTYQGFLHFVLPGTVTDIEHALDLPVVANGPDGAAYTHAVWIDLARGSSETVVLEFNLPTDMSQLTILPSARSAPVPWTIGRTQPQETNDQLPRQVELSALS